MEWLVYPVLLFVAGGIGGSLITCLLVSKKSARQQHPSPTSPLKNMRVALKSSTSSTWWVLYELEKCIFQRGGRIVAVPTDWTPDKATSIRASNSPAVFPDLIIDVHAEGKTHAYISARIYAADGSHIDTYQEVGDGNGIRSFRPICDSCVRACEEAIVRWQKQQSDDLLWQEIEELELPVEVNEIPRQLHGC